MATCFHRSLPRNSHTESHASHRSHVPRILFIAIPLSLSLSLSFFDSFGLQPLFPFQVSSRILFHDLSVASVWLPIKEKGRKWEEKYVKSGSTLPNSAASVYVKLSLSKYNWLYLYLNIFCYLFGCWESWILHSAQTKPKNWLSSVEVAVCSELKQREPEDSIISFDRYRHIAIFSKKVFFSLIRNLISQQANGDNGLLDGRGTGEKGWKKFEFCVRLGWILLCWWRQPNGA